MVLTVTILITQNFNLLIANAENPSEFVAEEITVPGEYDDVAIFEDDTILVYVSDGEKKKSVHLILLQE